MDGLLGPLIQISPGLARRIGVNEAAIVQRLHTCLQDCPDQIKTDGSRWLRMTPARWEEMLLRALSPELIIKLVIGLEARGLIVSADQMCGRDTGPCRWYALDYDVLDKIGEEDPGE